MELVKFLIWLVMAIVGGFVMGMGLIGADEAGVSHFWVYAGMIMYAILAWVGVQTLLTVI